MTAKLPVALRIGTTETLIGSVAVEVVNTKPEDQPGTVRVAWSGVGLVQLLRDVADTLDR